MIASKIANFATFFKLIFSDFRNFRNKVPDILKSAPGTPKDEEEPTNLQNIEELTQAKILEMRASEGADRTEGKHDMRPNTFHRYFRTYHICFISNEKIEWNTIAC